VLTDSASIFFDVPGGRLCFANGDLDVWAEHLTWCYRMMGVKDGATIATQDFGSSPVSFLGSKLLMPGLRRGVAERIDGRFICLDASAERVTLTPALLAQLPVDALVVRADIVELLAAELRKKGSADLARHLMKTIVVFGEDAPALNPARAKPWRHLMHIERSLLLAPECADCGCLHLRAGFYDVDGGTIRNLKLDLPPYDLARGELMPPGRCAASPDDWTIQLPIRRGGDHRSARA
jgi:hypothetical protein